MTRARLCRFTLSLVILAAVSGAGAEGTPAALFFLFKPTAAEPGDVVTVRTGGTPAPFTLRERIKPFKRPIRLYLVANSEAASVYSRFDRRAHFIGRLVPDANGRGVLDFTVPQVATGAYTVGAWCPGCAPYSGGRTWSATAVTSTTVIPRYRRLMLLSISVSPTESSPLISRGNVVALAVVALAAVFAAAGVMIVRGNKRR